MLMGTSGFDIRCEDFPTDSGSGKPRDVNSKFLRKPTRFRRDLERLSRAIRGWSISRGGLSVDRVHLPTGLDRRLVGRNSFSGLQNPCDGLSYRHFSAGLLLYAA